MSYFVDYSYLSLNKAGEELCGDTAEFFTSDKTFIGVMSDGLGSGVKANILATMTAKIAVTMLKEGLSIQEVEDTIAHTLPVCKERKLAYSTLTIVKIDNKGKVYSAEFDNPNLFFIHEGKIEKLNGKIIEINGRKIKETTFQMSEGDNLVCVSDGIIHAGVGTIMDLGWGWNAIAQYIEKIAKDGRSSRRIAEKIIAKCHSLYLNSPGDDSTVVSMKLIKPKFVTIFSGPPQNMKDDKNVIQEFINMPGKKIVCGGTSSKIVCKELNTKIEVDLNYVNRNIPPIAHIDGIDLVTEGVFTIRAAISKLKRVRESEDLSFLNSEDGASKLAKILFFDCTHLNMLIGKAINPIQQDFDFPEELSLRQKLLLELEDVMKSLGKIVKIKYY